MLLSSATVQSLPIFGGSTLLEVDSEAVFENILVLKKLPLVLV